MPATPKKTLAKWSEIVASPRGVGPVKNIKKLLSSLRFGQPALSLGTRGVSINVPIESVRDSRPVRMPPEPAAVIDLLHAADAAMARNDLKSASRQLDALGRLLPSQHRNEIKKLREAAQNLEWFADDVDKQIREFLDAHRTLILDIKSGLSRYKDEARNALCRPTVEGEPANPLPILSVSNGSVTRRGQKILSDVSCQLWPGDILGVLGVNGAGKTHLLEVMAAERGLTMGEVSYPGLEDEGLGGSYVYDCISYLPDEPMSFQHPLEYHLLSFLALRDVHREEARREVDQVVNLLRIGHLGERTSAEMSKGELARCALARALLAQPRILILDEPLEALDQPSRRVYLETIRDFANTSGTAVAISSHDVRSIELVATRTLTLDQGVILHQSNSVNPVKQDNLVVRMRCRQPEESIRGALGHLHLTSVSPTLDGYDLFFGRPYSFTEVLKGLVEEIEFDGAIVMSGTAEYVLEGLR